MQEVVLESESAEYRNSSPSYTYNYILMFGLHIDGITTGNISVAVIGSSMVHGSSPINARGTYIVDFASRKDIIS